MSIDFAKRSVEIELMDDLDCQGALINQTLRELDVINRLLGGNAITVKGVNQLLDNDSSKRPYSIADIGCGSGEMLRLIARQAERKGKQVALTGIDANPHIIGYAKENTTSYPHIEFRSMNIFSEEFRQMEFDLVLATLFLHHFTDEQLVALFRQLKNQTTVGIIVNDLHRHPLAYYSFKLISTLFSKSKMIKHDGLISVLRGFKKKELQAVLHKASITNYSLTWRWAFRWKLVIYTS